MRLKYNSAIFQRDFLAKSFSNNFPSKNRFETIEQTKKDVIANTPLQFANLLGYE